MAASVIHHKLDLVIRLIDTTNGYEVEERDVRFWKNKEEVRPIPRGSGNYIFLNDGRENCDLEVKVYGYDKSAVSIRYEELDNQIPMKEVYLIPSENTRKGQPVITFSGKLPGLESIQAVNLRSTGLCINGFDERRRIMTLFKAYRMNLDSIYYGLVHPDSKTFEPFVVMEEISEASVKVKEPLQEPFTTNSPIGRIIFGQVGKEGDYCIRVRDDSDQLQYVVRYVVDGETRFKELDFHHLDGSALD